MEKVTVILILTESIVKLAVEEITCVEKSLKEWCGPTRTNRVYIVFRTSGKSPSSYIRLHIYLKKLPGSTDSDSDSYSPSSSFGLIVGAFVGSAVVVFILMGCIVACKVAQQRRHAMPRTPYTVVQASAENVCSNQSLQQPVYQPPRQALFQAGLQGYQLHPLQSAQPVSTEQRYNMGTGYQPGPQAETGRNSFASLHRPTAPPIDNADPPPSYESVLK